MYGLSWVQSCNGKVSSGSGLFAKGVLLLLKKCSLSSQGRDHFIPDSAQVISNLMILLLKHFTLLTIWYCGPWSFCGNYSGVHPKNIWLCTGKAKWRECESIFRRCLSLINLLLYGNNIPGGLPSYLWELQLFFYTHQWVNSEKEHLNGISTMEGLWKWERALPKITDPNIFPTCL